MASLHFVKKARKPNKAAGIKKGDSYWWWKFRFGAKQCSKDKPRRSVLTQSNFYATLWDTEDDLIQAFDDFRNGDEDDTSSLKDALEEAASAIESLGEEQSSSRDNMPDHLQDVGTGELLGNRAEACEELAQALRDLADGWDEAPVADDEPEQGEDESEEDFDKVHEEWQEEQDQAMSDWRDGIADTISEVSFDIE